MAEQEYTIAVSRDYMIDLLKEIESTQRVIRITNKLTVETRQLRCLGLLHEALTKLECRSTQKNKK